MNTEAWIVVGVVGGALLLFASERVRPEGVGLLALLTLAFSGIITPAEAFAGFSNPAVITVAAMFLLSEGTVQAGLPGAIAGLLTRFGGGRLRLVVIMLILVVGGMSAFINNVAATVILIPAAVSLARGMQAAPSKLLMHLSFGSLMGGLVTLIGTPPNLLASEALAAAGYERFQMFDFVPTGAAVFGVGLLYMATVGARLLPERAGPDVGREVEQVRQFMGELVVPAESPVVGKTLLELRWQPRFRVTVTEIVRSGRRNRFPSAADVVYISDSLLVEGERDDVMRLAQAERLEFAVEARSADSLVSDDQASIVELVAGPSFAYAGQTVVQMNFRVRFGGLVLGIWRQGQPVRRALRGVAIQPGDVLLVRLPASRVPELADSQEFILLGQRPRRVRARPKMFLALGILAMVVALSATGVAHISVSASLGVGLMLVARVIPYERLYVAIEWRILVLIATLIPLGTAMETSGLASFAAGNVVEVLGPAGPIFMLAGVFVLTALLTQIMSNAAAVVLVAPIALGIASGMGIAPYPLLMMVAIAGSTAFLTPIGHQANVLVYNAAGYRFFDFVRVGGPLTLIILAVSLAVVPIVWPL